MAGGRPKGRGDNPMNPRTRNESDQALKNRINAAAATRKANNEAKKAAAAEKAAKQASEKKKAFVDNFFGGGIRRKDADSTSTTARPETETGQTESAATAEIIINATDEINDKQLNVGAQKTADETGKDDDVITIDCELPSIEEANDIVANLDICDDVNPDDHFDCDDGFEEVQNGKPTGLQQSVVKLIQERLEEEVRDTNKSANTWLLTHLKENDFWIRKEHACRFAKKLGLKKRAPMAYYRDIYVFLPDIKYGCQFMPCCPNCKQNLSVGNNGFRKNHFGRLIIGMKTTYYVLSRRYRCYDCERKRNDICADSADEDTLQDSDTSSDNTMNNSSYSFMAWDKRILHLYPYGVGMEFPAVLTWRSGVDKVVADWMRPLFNKGIKPAQFAKSLMELHTAEYDRLRLLHEYKTKSIREGAFPNAKIEPLGEFADVNGNRGIAVSGAYMEHVYKEQHKSIRPFLDKEVKKRGAESLHWDASFKEAGNLSQCQGKPIFKGMITGLNENNEIRSQFHFVSESHEQMRPALQAFENTRNSFGFPGVTHVYVDNPRGDMNLFLDALPSVKEQQERYNRGIGVQQNASLPSYPYEKLKVRKATVTSDIEMVVTAMKENIGSHRRVGLDTEWNQLRRKNGMQYGRSKIQWIQLAYRDKDDNIRVLLLWVGSLKSLPNSLKTLLCDNTLIFAGNRVSTDLKYIGQDFKLDGIRSIDQNKRVNVVNVGVHARKRDVTRTGVVRLDTLAELTLNVAVDKSQQISEWRKELSPEQEKYIAIDAAVSLEIFEALEKMPDLTRRLSAEEAVVGRKVDLLPPNGSVACMATRGATGTIIESRKYTCPEGYLLSTRRGNRRTVNVGKGSFIIRIEKIHSPGMVLPKYQKRGTASKEVTLGDLGKIDVLLPLSMLKEHISSDHVRPTPIHPRTAGISLPATTEPTLRQSERGQIKRKHSPVDGYASDDSEYGDEDESGNDDFSEEAIEDSMKTLTMEDIELLRAAIHESEEIQEGKMPLQCDKLEDPPRPDEIPNRFSAVLGDPFHEMDRPKASSTKHAFKKAYFVALREAMFIWNQKTYSKLYARMKASGLSDDEIEKRKYYNARFFRECVDRIIPPPKILYYRLRAVFVFFGNKIDSSTGQPLFNALAWKKANNVLKEAREGLFSDPPDLQLYKFQLGPNGEVLRNKYGLEKLKCMRGTNGAEACHKHLSVTFKSWHVGHEMSNCLLGEFRHRWNHHASERNRFGFPKIGHYDTWLIDKLQNLMVENHGIQCYPHWTNASDFRPTDESFDTIALHNEALHEALEARCRELNDIKLTREHAYIAKSMGTPLPFLPVVSVEEKKAFAELVLDGKGAINFDDAAVEWCKYVDGENVMPKLPSHLRTHYQNWTRKMRIEECLKEARSGIELLQELNKQISLQPSADLDTTSAPNESMTDSASNQRHASWKQPSMPSPLPQPPNIALQHTGETDVVGGIVITKDPPLNTAAILKKRKPRRKCGVCKQEGCKGLGGRRHCPLLLTSKNKRKKPTEDVTDGVILKRGRRCQLCVQFGGGKHPNCTTGNGNRDFCQYYFRDGRPK